MAQAKVMHGARAQLIVGGNKVGIFNSVSYGLAYDTQDVFILGRFSPAEIGYVAQEAVSITASGWRIIDAGPHDTQGAQVPHLQDLLTHNDISLAIYDRLTNKQVATITGVRPTGYSTSISQRQMQEITVNFKGLLVSDESQPQNAENGGAQNKASDLP